VVTNFTVKMGEIGRLTFIRRIDIPKRVENRNSDFRAFICDDLATLCKNLVNCGPGTPEFKRGMDVHPTPRVDQLQFSYVRFAAPLLDLAVISTEFSGAITTQFCFTYTLEGMTAMPRGLHVRICHALLAF